MFVAHAYRLLVLWGPADMIGFTKSYGMPFPAVTFWYVVLAHGLGGVLLVLGVLARWMALLNVPALAVALFVVHRKQGFFMDQDGGYELALLALMATLALACLGPGAFTLKR
jgi:putative oxidoreductase